MAEYDANEQGDLQELEGGIEQNLSDSASAAKNIYNAQRKYRTNHKNDAEEVSDDYDTSHQNNKLDKTSNANSPPQNKPPNGKSHSKANQKKSLRDKKSAESSAAKKSSSKLAQKKSKKGLVIALVACALVRYCVSTLMLLARTLRFPVSTPDMKVPFACAYTTVRFAE